MKTRLGGDKGQGKVEGKEGFLTNLNIFSFGLNNLTLTLGQTFNTSVAPAYIHKTNIFFEFLRFSLPSQIELDRVNCARLRRPYGGLGGSV